MNKCKNKNTKNEIGNKNGKIGELNILINLKLNLKKTDKKVKSNINSCK